MKNNIREYHSLRFFRDSKKSDAEMQYLADTGQDFEYRRLLIEENELDLHIYFSRMTFFNWLSWGFLALAFCPFQFPIMTSGFLGLAIIFSILAYICKRKFKFVLRCYILALAVVDCVIQKDHGISIR